MSKQQNYQTEEFRREAVRLLESSGKSVSVLARELGISEKSLYRWRKKYGSQSRSEASAPSPESAELAAEVKRLQRENKVLRQEREILKKALSIFSQNQP